MLSGPVYDAESAIATALTAALVLLFGGLIRLAGFLAICFVGWLLADLLVAAAARRLGPARVDALWLRAGLGSLTYQLGLSTGPAGVACGIVRWSARLLALIVALDGLGVPGVSTVLGSIVLWVPNVVAAVAALLIGGLSARAVHRLVRESAAQAGLAHDELLGVLARAAVWGFAAAVALTQLGIAADVIHLLFAGVVAALALGFGIAAGLGGQEAAGALVGRAYESLRRVELPEAHRPPNQSRAVAPPASSDAPPAPRRRPPAQRRRGLVGGPSSQR
jgi:hypothetical protein